MLVLQRSSSSQHHPHVVLLPPSPQGKKSRETNLTGVSERSTKYTSMSKFVLTNTCFGGDGWIFKRCNNGAGESHIGSSSRIPPQTAIQPTTKAPQQPDTNVNVTPKAGRGGCED